MVRPTSLSLSEPPSSIPSHSIDQPNEICATHPRSVYISPQCPMLRLALQRPRRVHDSPLQHPRSPEAPRQIARACACTRPARPVDATRIRARLCGPADKCTRWLMLASPRCFASLSFLLTTNLSDPQFGDVLGALQALTRTVGYLALPTPRDTVHPHSPPHSQDFRRHSSGRCVISRNSWAAANLRGCIIFFARVLTHFPHFLPPPQPIPPLSPFLLSSIPAYRAAGRRGQERWHFSRRVLPYLLPVVSELVSQSPINQVPPLPGLPHSPLITTQPTTHMPTITLDIPCTAPHWPSLKLTRFGSRTHPSNLARASRVPVVHILRPSRSSGFPQPQRSTLATSH